MHITAAQVRSVRNSAALRGTALVEALNLRAAVELQLRSPPGCARQALTDLPPRAEEELDPVRAAPVVPHHCLLSFVVVSLAEASAC